MLACGKAFKDGFAVLISLIALGVSVYQCSDTHAQLIYSLKPLVDFDTEDDPDVSEIGIAIQNDGPAPAIIKSLAYYVDGKPVQDLATALQIAQINSNNVAEFEFLTSDALATGAKYWLIRYKKRGVREKAEIVHFADFIDDHVAISVTYCSLLKDCASKCSTPGMCQ